MRNYIKTNILILGKYFQVAVGEESVKNLIFFKCKTSLLPRKVNDNNHQIPHTVFHFNASQSHRYFDTSKKAKK